MGSVRRVPSDVLALRVMRKSPSSWFSPLVTLRVVMTPRAGVGAQLPKTMATMLTAVPRSCEMTAAVR